MSDGDSLLTADFSRRSVNAASLAGVGAHHPTKMESENNDVAMANLSMHPEHEEDEDLDESEEGGDEAWDDSQEGDEEDEATVSLFDTTVLPSAEAAFQHDQSKHGFELRAYAAQVITSVLIAGFACSGATCFTLSTPFRLCVQ